MPRTYSSTQTSLDASEHGDRHPEGISSPQGHTLKHWSSTQQTVALSSGEADLVGIARGADPGLGFKALAHDLGCDVSINVITGATAAVGICKRRGLGKSSHLAVSDLWVQERLRHGDFSLTNIPGSYHP